MIPQAHIRVWTTTALIAIGAIAMSCVHAVTQRDVFRELVQIAATADPHMHDYIFHETALAQAHAGFYDDAVSTARRVNKGQRNLLEWVTVERAKNGDVAGAVSMARAALPGDSASGAIVMVAQLQADRNDVAAALRTGTGLTGFDARGVLYRVGYAQVRLGDIDAALETARRLAAQGEPWIDPLLFDAVSELYRRGEDTRALGVAQQIKDTAFRPDRDAVLAIQAAKEKNWIKAASIARATARKGPSLLITVAENQAETHDTAGIASLLSDATAAALNQRDPARAHALGKIASLQIEAGITPAALREFATLPDSESVQIDGLRYPASTSCDVPWALARAHQFDLADSVVTRGAKCSYVPIARAELAAGRPDAAAHRMHRAPNPADVSAGMAELATDAAKAGDVRTALRFAEMIKVTHASYEDGYLAPAVRAITRAWATSGDVTGALAWARQRETGYDKAMALLGVAEAMVRVNPKRPAS